MTHKDWANHSFSEGKGGCVAEGRKAQATTRGLTRPGKNHPRGGKKNLANVLNQSYAWTEATPQTKTYCPKPRQHGQRSLAGPAAERVGRNK